MIAYDVDPALTAMANAVRVGYHLLVRHGFSHDLADLLLDDLDRLLPELERQPAPLGSARTATGFHH